MLAFNEQAQAFLSPCLEKTKGKVMMALEGIAEKEGGELMGIKCKDAPHTFWQNKGGRYTPARKPSKDTLQKFLKERLPKKLSTLILSSSIEASSLFQLL